MVHQPKEGNSNRISKDLQRASMESYTAPVRTSQKFNRNVMEIGFKVLYLHSRLRNYRNKGKGKEDRIEKRQTKSKCQGHLRTRDNVECTFLYMQTALSLTNLKMPKQCANHCLSTSYVDTGRRKGK